MGAGERVEQSDQGTEDDKGVGEWVVCIHHSLTGQRIKCDTKTGTSDTTHPVRNARCNFDIFVVKGASATHNVVFFQLM